MKTIFLLLVMLVFVSGILAQDEVMVVDAQTTAQCEGISSYLAIFAASIDPNDTITIISTKGSNETKNLVAEQRLLNARVYLVDALVNTAYARKKETVLPTIGARSTPTGQMDFFVKGKLRLQLFFWRNRGLRLGPCVSENEKACSDSVTKLYYPCRKYSRSGI